jgi:hypothetical protein
MSMLNKNGFESLAAGEPLTETQPITETQPSFRGAFGDVYRFILQAVKGDRAVADMIFEDYLDGKLSEELLSISRACVSAEQAGRSNNRKIDEGWCREPTTARALEVSDDAHSAAAS